MIIAITGATSMIGSDLVKISLQKGHKVIAIIKPNSKNLPRIPINDNVAIIESNLSDYSNISEEEKCDIFFHLAWDKTSVSKRDDIFSQKNNIDYSLNAVTLANKWGAKAFVGAGSQAEFGPVNDFLSKDTPTNPESGYGICKYAAGKLCKLYCEQLKIKYNWARIVSVYGEYDSPGTLTMYLINSLLDGKSPDLTKCEQIWNYTYSEDVAEALFSIAIKGIDGKTYCIGNGDNRPLKEYVETIGRLINSDIKLNFGVRDYYPHQPMFLCPDITELTKDTNFIPKYTYETGISKVIKYVKEQKQQR